jgi:voltage-gated potassium channel
LPESRDHRPGAPPRDGYPLRLADARAVVRDRRVAQRARTQRELRMFTRRLGILLGALTALILVGAILFALVQHVSVAYGLVWTLDTVTTLGSIQDPRGVAGRVVIVALELFGIGTLFYALATVAEFFVSGQLSGLLEEHRTQRMIDSYTDHFIVCGFGRVGRQASRDLRAAGVAHVAIDENPEHSEDARALAVPYLESDAAADEVLLEAGIMRARGVIACVDSDAQNIFITLSARGLRSDILIIARASADDSEKKLLRAGADRVVSPYKTSGTEMARVALRPQVAGTLQVADYRMEEIEVSAGCKGAGQTVAEVRGESVIVALRRGDGQLETQPALGAVINPGDMLIAIGTPSALERLESMFEPLTASAS